MGFSILVQCVCVLWVRPKVGGDLSLRDIARGSFRGQIEKKSKRKVAQYVCWHWQPGQKAHWRKKPECNLVPPRYLSSGFSFYALCGSTTLYVFILMEKGREREKKVAVLYLEWKSLSAPHSLCYVWNAALKVPWANEIYAQHLSPGGFHCWCCSSSERVSEWGDRYPITLPWIDFGLTVNNCWWKRKSSFFLDGD